ncbi:hypothetical protein IMCC3317_16280 [Kordia antarctica]|uniref:Uncharacterized protein n=1 Tax=Kordia antarctica TaxID=1218801 RepID=A0A7L4ZHR6_9FLAO|nr:hypothetical protein [Kordia antarctica]QHI36268.1 hypothetical protein IMCC3317_16280 [Kordia antarctica]
MRNKTKYLDKLLLSKVRIAKVNEREMISGGGRRTREGNSKTGDTRMHVQVQAHDVFVK